MNPVAVNMEKRQYLVLMITCLVIILGVYGGFWIYTNQYFNGEKNNEDPGNNNISKSSWYYLFKNNYVAMGSFPAKYWASFPENIGNDSHVPFEINDTLSRVDFGFNTQPYSTTNIQCVLYKMSEKNGKYEIDKELYASNKTTQDHHRIYVTPENQGYWTFVFYNQNELSAITGAYAIAFKKDNS